MVEFLGNRLVIVKNHSEWWLSFWLKHPQSEKVYFSGGLGKWRLVLSRGILSIRLDWNLKEQLGLLSVNLKVSENSSKTILRL